MKRFLFIFISSVFAVTSFATNLGKNSITRIAGDNDSSLTQQSETLILEQPSQNVFGVGYHYSHGSHGSHGSHSSHSSHSSHYSGW